MGHPVGPATGGEPYDHALRGASAQTGGDQTVRPEARPFSDPIELANSPEGRRIEQKLRAEALARRSAEDDDAIIDPTGHA
ncbi:hypothetical protein LJR219_002987 [Phenylobacterium sp. LjRoot219]|uniref:hypothetical protein n=1 Tax=Phenylobacterium sp. LjRoot219 TaxID=3342283 RepID=UPI003ED11B6F